MSSDELTGGELSGGELTGGELTGGEFSAGELSSCAPRSGLKGRNTVDATFSTV